MSSFKVDILTPSKIIAQDIEASELTIPTCDGEINVLLNHTHIITKLETGIMTITSNEKKEYYTITHGLCKIIGDKVIILSNVSETSKHIDLKRAETALENAQKKLSGKEHLSSYYFTKYMRKMNRAQARINIAKNLSK
jgi:F-type H+-transporting ATPase subunit epsilon